MTKTRWHIFGPPRTKAIAATAALAASLIDLLHLYIKDQSSIMPNTHRRRRRDETVESRRVGDVNTPVGSRDPVYNFLC